MITTLQSARAGSGTARSQEGRTQPGEVRAAGVRIELASRRAFLGEQELALAPKEFDLLSLLVTVSSPASRTELSETHG